MRIPEKHRKWWCTTVVSHQRRTKDHLSSCFPFQLHSKTILRGFRVPEWWHPCLVQQSCCSPCWQNLHVEIFFSFLVMLIELYFCKPFVTNCKVFLHAEVYLQINFCLSFLSDSAVSQLILILFPSPCPSCEPFNNSGHHYQINSTLYEPTYLYSASPCLFCSTRLLHFEKHWFCHSSVHVCLNITSSTIVWVALWNKNIWTFVNTRWCVPYLLKRSIPVDLTNCNVISSHRIYIVFLNVGLVRTSAQPVLQASTAPASGAPADFTQKGGGRGLRPRWPPIDILDS